MNPDDMLAKEFIAYSSQLVNSDSWMAIRFCVQTLSQGQYTWKPTPSVESVGDILRRLARVVDHALVSCRSRSSTASRPVEKEREASVNVLAEGVVAYIEPRLDELSRIIQQLDRKALIETTMVDGHKTNLMTVVMGLRHELATAAGEVSCLTQIQSGSAPTCRY